MPFVLSFGASELEGFMWVIKFALMFLLLWGVWYVCCTVLFAGWDIFNDIRFGPLMVIGAAVTAFLTSKILERGRRKNPK